MAHVVHPMLREGVEAKATTAAEALPEGARISAAAANLQSRARRATPLDRKARAGAGGASIDPAPTPALWPGPAV